MVIKRPRRVGGGFYDYPAGGKKVLLPGLKQFEKPGGTYDLEELKKRFLYRYAIETARCLEEGVLTTTHDANIGSIFGIGFPTWTGGALQTINREGVADFVKNADALAAKYSGTASASRCRRSCATRRRAAKAYEAMPHSRPSLKSRAPSGCIARVCQKALFFKKVAAYFLCTPSAICCIH